MSLELAGKNLSELIRELLAAASRQNDMNWLGDVPEVASDRLLGIQDGERGQIVQIASDGLNLDQKSKIEQWLQHELSKKEQFVTIYFKRKLSFGDRLQNQAPAASPPSSAVQSPFGVKLRTRAIPGVEKIIAVSSGKGGVGKSTISVNLATGLVSQGYKVGLLDADLYGPSVPMMMGMSSGLSISPDQKMIPPEKYGVKVLSFGFMSDPYHPVIWRGPMVAKALEQLFYKAEWGELDYLIIDLPPGTGDVQLTMIESLPIYGGIVVSTPQAVALLDAHKGLSMFQKLKVPVLGLVENMSHFQCSACGHVDDVFGRVHINEFAAERNVPIIGRIPLHKRIREAADSGMPVVMIDPQFAVYFMSIIDAVLQHEDMAD